MCNKCGKTTLYVRMYHRVYKTRVSYVRRKLRFFEIIQAYTTIATSVNHIVVRAAEIVFTAVSN